MMRPLVTSLSKFRILPAFDVEDAGRKIQLEASRHHRRLPHTGFIRIEYHFPYQAIQRFNLSGTIAFATVLGILHNSPSGTDREAARMCTQSRIDARM
jgi:hypothetical protein